MLPTASSRAHAWASLAPIHIAPNDLNAITGVDAALFYSIDINVARAFVERFACGLAVVQTVERGAHER